MPDLNQLILSCSTLKIQDGRKTLPRNQDQSKKWSRRDPSKIVGVCIHQSLAANGSARGVALYDISPECHLAFGKGVPSISYTMFVERDGDIFLCNDIEDKTWSQGDALKPGDENEMFLAICFDGDFSGDGYKGSQEPTDRQIEILPKLWAHLKDILKLKNNGLHGHYDFGKPACPGTTLKAMIENIRSVKDWDDPKFDLSTAKGRQAALQSLGYYKGYIDGLWGIGCRSALTQFQLNSGLTPDGVWGNLTTNAMMRILATKGA